MHAQIKFTANAMVWSAPPPCASPSRTLGRRVTGRSALRKPTAGNCETLESSFAFDDEPDLAVGLIARGADWQEIGSF